MNSKIALTIASLILLQPTTGQATKVLPRNTNMAEELVSFDTCQALDAHVRSLPSAYYEGYSYGGMLRKGENRKLAMPKNKAIAGRAEMEVSQMATVDASSAEPEAKTGTNNQVENVDEADFVKFNGKYIYQIHNGTLRILKAWPARELNQIGSISINGQPQEMLMNDSTAVIMANDGQSLKATIIDISQPSSPRMLTEFEIPGYYKTARLVGDTLRIVNQDYNGWQMLDQAEVNTSDKDWLQTSSSPSRRLNIRPTTQILNGNRRTIDVVKDCKNVYVPKTTAPQELTRIISIDLKAKKYEETLAYVRPDTVYASERAIYLAQSGYGDFKGLATQQTAIHKFAIKKSETARYQAGGVVNGTLINQFAMDEHNDNLRVATYGSELKGTSFWGGDSQWITASRVQVLTQRGKNLKNIGQSEDLGKGERLYSVRFDGDKGYVVTFRQVDPLYTLDLKNPYRPRVMGELKVPGFSTYIHTLGKNHLLTIGQDADETTGRVRGLKLSVFDVSNYSRPKEVKSLIFKSNVASDATYEHKAFTFYREKGVLAIPASQNGSRHSLLLFNVSTSDIKAGGEVNMSDLQSVSRSFFADGFVYAIGGLGVRAADLQNPSSPLATVFYDRNLAEAGW